MADHVRICEVDDRERVAVPHLVAEAAGDLVRRHRRLVVVAGHVPGRGHQDPRFAGEKTTRVLRDNGFSWCWQDIPFARRISLPADKFFPAACFDHIFVRNGKFNSARVIEMSRGSSDHNAIFAEVQLKLQ